MTTLAYLQWVERKVIAHIQVRPGPVPRRSARPAAAAGRRHQADHQGRPAAAVRQQVLYLLAPFLAVTMALLSISVIPFGPEIDVAGHHTWMQLTDLNIGVLFVLAVSSDGRLRHRAGRLGFEQQVLAAGRPAQLGADDQLRAAACAWPSPRRC